MITANAIFFARVPATVPPEDLIALFSKYGHVQHLNLYRRWATAKTSKGCGVVEFSTPDEAKAAMMALSGHFSFGSYPGFEGPMVCERLDPSKVTAPPDQGELHWVK